MQHFRNIEIIATNKQDVILINQSIATRIELCAGMEYGGYTPDITTVKECLEVSLIPIRVMIRNQECFENSLEQFELMKEQIKNLRHLSIDAFVLGANKNQTINQQQLSELMKVADPIPVVYHRAFDHLNNSLDQLKKLIKLGVVGILTSGVDTNVNEHSLENIKKYLEYEIEVTVGGGLNLTNYHDFYQLTSIHLGTAVRLDNTFNTDISVEKIDSLKL